MNIILSQTSDEPLYLQLYHQISSQIIKGELKGESVLPPIRTIAKELRVSIITVKKAWEMLEREGFILTSVGRGSFVSPLSEENISDRRTLLAENRLREELRYYRSLGMSLKELLEAVTSLYEQDGE